MKKTIITKQKLLPICKKNDIILLGLFGSVAKGKDTPQSDVDLLAKFSKTKSLFDLVRIEREFANVLGRKVDLLTEGAISPLLKDRILNELQILYERAR